MLNRCRISSPSYSAVSLLKGACRNKSYDVAVLGGGPGGYVAAIQAAKAGLKVACVEERPLLGGTCLNVGCIPTKALLNMTAKFHEAKQAKKFGFTAGSLNHDWAKMQTNKDGVVNGLGKGIDYLFKKHKIDVVKGHGQLRGADIIATPTEEIIASNIILAMGSVAAPMPGGFLPFDEKRVLSSTGAMNLRSLPKKLLIIGGGAIGLEFASVFSRVGVKVEVIEFMPQVAAGFDTDVATAIAKLLQKEGIKFHLSHKVVGAQIGPEGVKLQAEKLKDGNKIVDFDGDAVLVAVGRRPNSEGLEQAGIKLDRQRRVEVNDAFQTNLPNVRAIGDLIAGPMLAHKAEEDACLAVKAIMGNLERADYTNCPGVIYTHPEVAMVGISEDTLKSAGSKYTKGVVPFQANSRARANMESDGFVKVLTSPEGKILGGSIVGNGAGDLIQTLVIARKFGIGAEELGELIYPHPCLVEGVKEAALLSVNKAVHF